MNQPTNTGERKKNPEGENEVYQIIKLLGELKDAVRNDDNEAAHVRWDSILILVIQKHQPALWKKMKLIRKQMPFWYA